MSIPLLRIADFQTAWYMSMLCAAILGVAVGGTVWTVRALRPMWRAGDRGPALLIATVAAVTWIWFVAALLAVVVTLLQQVF